jgi:GNAT superfamily N-acetyltransferase
VPGTVVNVPLEAFTGADVWLEAVEAIIPLAAERFRPDIVVSQHGADTHAWDPLAHLRVTTTAMGAAARLTDRVVHRYTKDGGWLSTGGGGYDAYRVVPRTWSLVWLAGAHRDPPVATSATWRERWESEAEQYDQAPLPERFDDEPNAGLPPSDLQELAERRSVETLALVRRLVVPTILRAAEDRGWWNANDELARPRRKEADDPDAGGEPELRTLDAEALDRLRLVHGALPVAGAGVATAVARAAARGGAVVVGAVDGDRAVGLAIGVVGEPARILSLGVGPGRRRKGLGRALLARLVEELPGPILAEVGLAERDPIHPLPVETRATIARSLLEGAGFRVSPAPDPIGSADPTAIVARR